MIWAVSWRCWIGKMFRYIFTFLWLFTLAFAATAQTGADSLRKKYPSGSFAPVIKNQRYYTDSLHSPHKAFMRSLFLPGLGQLYNNRWWKVPIVYGGIGLLGSAVAFNQKNYKLFSSLAILKRDDPAALTSPQNHHYALYQKYKTEYIVHKDWLETDLTNTADYYQRFRDLSVLGVLAFWTINVLDAYIDAKFINSFSVDNNLTISPVSDVSGLFTYASTGIGTGSINPGLKIIFVMR
jgi:hypothetical protein